MGKAEWGLGLFRAGQRTADQGYAMASTRRTFKSFASSYRKNHVFSGVFEARRQHEYTALSMFSET